MIRTSAIVFQSSPYLEHDLMVELFCLTLGRIRVFLKYAQSKKPRFGGLMNTLNLLNVDLIERRNGYQLVGATLVNGFNNIKSSYPKMNGMYAMIQCIKQMTQQQMQHDELFYFASSLSDKVDQSSTFKLSTFKIYLLKSLLSIEGLVDEKTLDNYNDEQMVILFERYTGVSLKSLAC